ncbi:alpha/beta fold hydrolase [Streptomyces sp. NPDC001139]
MRPIFVLVHSPSVGPSTWRPVAERLVAAGYQVRVPSLLGVGSGAPPFWPRVVDAVRDDLRRVPAGRPVVLVAHSNAGLFVPVTRAALDRPVVGTVFVDAALPARSGPTPVATPELLDFLRPLAVEARERGWRVAHLPGEHLHQIVDPDGTARHLVELAAPAQNNTGSV